MLDFAGGAVIHVNVVAAMFVSSLVLGKRRRYLESTVPEAPLPLMGLGITMLWMGSVGWISGSALGANGLAVSSVVNTQIAAAASSLVWLLLDRFFKGEPSLAGIALGLIAGWVAITSGAGFVTISGALGIGIGASVFSYFIVMFLKKEFRSTTTPLPFLVSMPSVHRCWEFIRDRSVGDAQRSILLGANGLFWGNPMQFAIQIKMILTTVLYSFMMTYFIFRKSSIWWSVCA